MSNLLSGDKIQLRALEPDDLDTLFQWENDTEIWNVSETLSPISKHILQIYINNSHKDIYENKQLRFIVQLKNAATPIGTIDLFDYDPYNNRAGVGILIANKEERQKGYAIEALSMIKSYCFDILKMTQLWCSISVENKSSIKLFQKAGFEITGTRKKWRWNGDSYFDEYFLQLLK